MKKQTYIRNPQAIYDASFACIENILAKQNTQHLNPIEKKIAIRMMHACGNVENILHNLWFSPKSAALAKQLLHAGTPILCDTHMVRSGILKPAKTQTTCIIKHQKIATYAQKNGITKAMSAMHHLKPKIPQSIILIANAPTALFYLIEMLESQKVQPPKLIVGMPVGFVGAQESKHALIEASKKYHIPAIALQGIFGGSAVSSALINALI